MGGGELGLHHGRVYNSNYTDVHVHSQLPVPVRHALTQQVNEDALNYLFNDRLLSRKCALNDGESSAMTSSKQMFVVTSQCHKRTYVTVVSRKLTAINK